MKKIQHSKTFWLNLLAGLVATATYVDAELLSILSLTFEEQMKVLKITGIIVSLGNIYLRTTTTQPIKGVRKNAKK